MPATELATSHFAETVISGEPGINPKTNQRLGSMALPVAVFACPALAQDEAAQVVGTAVGGLIGLLILIAIGAVVGWLASLIVKGNGSGLLGDILFGIGGALIAGRLLPLIGLSLGGVVGSFIAALIGAVFLILIVRLIRKAAS